MSRAFLFFIILLGELMAAELESIEANGIKMPLIYERSTLLPTVNVQVIFERSGSMEDGELAGLAYISSRLLNEGTKKEGAVEFARKLENRAIHLSVSSGLETTVLDISCLKSEFKEGMALLRVLIKDPNYTEDAFKKVKLDIEGAILSKQNDFDYIAQINLIKNLFEDTPLESPNIGTLESLKRISLKDIKSFLQNHLVLNRAIVMVGGDIKLDEVKDELKKMLELFPVGEKPKTDYFEAKSEERFVVEKKETKQAYIYFGSPYSVKATDKDAYKAKVATFILGAGGFGSRIMEEVRVKRGLAYSAYARAHINKTNSYMSGLLQTKLENQDDAIKVVKEVIGGFVKEGANEKELEGAKRFLLGSEPLRSELLNQRLSTTFNEYYKGLPLGASKEELKKIENLTLKELNEYIKSHDEITKLTFSVVTKDEKSKK